MRSNFDVDFAKLIYQIDHIPVYQVMVTWLTGHFSWSTWVTVVRCDMNER